jgi:hypothetical protein
MVVVTIGAIGAIPLATPRLAQGHPSRLFRKSSAQILVLTLQHHHTTVQPRCQRNIVPRNKLQKPLVHIPTIDVQLFGVWSIEYRNDDGVSLPLPVRRLRHIGSGHNAMSECASTRRAQKKVDSDRCPDQRVRLSLKSSRPALGDDMTGTQTASSTGTPPQEHQRMHWETSPKHEAARTLPTTPVAHLGCC